MLLALIALLVSRNVLAAVANLMEKSTNWTRHPGVELMLF